jgi:hypothetical protein
MLKCDKSDCNDSAVYFAEIWFDHKTPTFIKYCSNTKHLIESKVTPNIDLNHFDGEVKIERLTEEEFVVRTVANS